MVAKFKQVIEYMIVYVACCNVGILARKIHRDGIGFGELVILE